MVSVRPALPCAECGGTDLEKGRLTSGGEHLCILPNGDGVGWGVKLREMFAKRRAIDALVCATCGAIRLYAADRSPRV